jgi:hypothetical protein
MIESERAQAAQFFAAAGASWSAVQTLWHDVAVARLTGSD